MRWIAVAALVVGYVIWARGRIRARNSEMERAEWLRGLRERGL